MSNTQSRPNIIFVLTDDQGYGDLSCLGNPILKTPELDRLHADSVRLTDFHVAPMCTPTRGELMTGQDALRNGATFVCMGRSLLRADLPTMADILAENGYHTGHFGKWHMGDNYPYRPQDRGFHETIHHPAFGITSAADYYGNDYFDDHYRHKDEIKQYLGYCTDVWFEEAMRWMQGCHDRNEPFFAYIATNAPHGPYWVPDEYRQPYLDGIERDEASFFGMIANIDENMAQLEKFLQDNEIRDNTILIFMTDNGTAMGEGIYNAGMRGRKTSLYEGGHRVPCFIRWPAAGLEGGRDVGGVTRGVDILPTLIELCDLQAPDGWTCDGLSLAAHMRQPDKAVADRTSVVQYGHANEGARFGFTGRGRAAVMWGRWRLVDGRELYNIGEDPGQQQDVAGANPELVKQLRGQYGAWWDGVSSTLTSYQPLTIGADAENPARLCSCDWAWVYADNQRGIRGPVMDSGTWHVEAARAGLYSFTLRRWPEESGLGISDPAPVMQGVDGSWPAGKALPVASAWLQVGRSEQTLPVPPDATAQTFEMAVERGPTTVKSWWHDEQGSPLAGAYYLTAERLRE
ncbi:MAG: arylsulfatase [Caldilineaceae bacterium SB0668_bin_21]|nr:arylsulfatase [Caldilineaceae bacterium SB0668_bin_21]MYC20800.1 arylsulfatase [Caldilineaceae bacterium SB0662_bin_25]